jgi:DNA-binding transcriptional LysR family regulator
MSERLVLIAPPGKGVSEANLAQGIGSESFVMREEGSSARRHALEFLRRLNIMPDKLNIVASLTDTQSILNAVSKGLGLAVVSELAAREQARSGLVSIVEPPGAPYKRSYYFVTRKDAVLSAPARLLMDYVCDYCLAEACGVLGKERAM